MEQTTGTLIGVVSPSELAQGNATNWRALETFEYSYDVGREGVGIVTKPFVKGVVYTGQIQTQGMNVGDIRFNAVHEANGKYYNTGIFLSREHFEEAPETVVNPENQSQFFSDITDKAQSVFDKVKASVLGLNNKERIASLAILALIVMLFIRKK